jgi:hypothetical protein
MIRKAYDFDPLRCPRCGSAMRGFSFLAEHAVVDRIIDHLKLSFSAERPQPPEVAFGELLWEADLPAEYDPSLFPSPKADFFWLMGEGGNFRPIPDSSQQPRGKANSYPLKPDVIPQVPLQVFGHDHAVENQSFFSSGTFTRSTMP